MNAKIISKEQAQNFLVNYHGLGCTKYANGEHGVLAFVKTVGCIQYDPLNVVGRNADLVLQSRIESYTPKMLEKIMYTDRALIDGWDKMMAIYMAKDWPYFKRIRECHTKSVVNVLANRNHLEALELTQAVTEIIEVEGPKLARDIEFGIAQKGSWGHGKLSSVALDYLFHTGVLGISDKKNTQKVYELNERLLSTELFHAEDPFESDQAFYKWYVKRRIGSVGLLWGKEGGGWLGHFLSDKALRKTTIEELVTEAHLKTIQINGIDETFYIRNEDMPCFEKLSNPPADEVHFLAPLDNFLWDRGLIETLFNFKYSWEVYVPQAKRKFGYYVLPVLYGNRFIARFEPEKHRNREVLHIKNWWWEEDVAITEDMRNAILKALEQFCNYLGASGVSEESVKLIFKDAAF